MSQDSNGDIYAEFGVNGAVMSSNNITEHEQNMLKLNVSARDGDDSLELSEDQEEGTTEELEEGSEEGQEEGQEENEEGADEGAESDDFTPLSEPDAELVAASESLSEYADGFSQMREQAIKSGLSAEAAAQVEREYENDNKLSEESLKALEAVGYSRGFVASFIQGQEAIAHSYVGKIVAYAGGQAKFDQIVSHLKANSPDSLETLNDAITRQDLKAVKTVINLGMASHTKKFGKQPQRSVTKRAPAVAAKGTQKGPQGFDSQREMVKAMSDPRYQNDSAYRAEVETRVGRSIW